MTQKQSKNDQKMAKNEQKITTKNYAKMIKK